MGFRYAYSTNAYTRYDLFDAIGRVAELGFDGVEILADFPHALPAHLDDFESVKRAVEDAGLAVSNINANTARGLVGESVDAADVGPTFLDPDPVIRAARMDHIAWCIDFAAALGAPCSVTTGPSPEGMSEDEGLERCVDGLRDVMTLAESAGVKIGIEYEPGFLIGDAERLQWAFDEVDHPLLGANYDIGHAVVAHEDPVEGLRRFHDRIWNLHVEDIQEDVHYHLIPGSGDIDFARLFEEIVRLELDAFLTLELYTMSSRPDGAGKTSLANLRRVWRQLQIGNDAYVFRVDEPEDGDITVEVEHLGSETTLRQVGLDGDHVERVKDRLLARLTREVQGRSDC
jgi:sugar phosphate isomerase/epimerase